jgi:Acyl carrier protein phosphodiesterase
VSKLLFINASPRGERSHSLSVAREFVRTYAALHPGDVVETRDLFQMALPALDGEVLRVKYNIMHGRESTAEEKNRWKAVEDVIEDFKSADKLVFAVPMWNFNIPYVLKHYLDVICQPSYTFAAGPEGYKGLCSARVFIAYARGGEYPATGAAQDIYNFQSTYLEFQLRFLGITDIQSVIVQPTLREPEVRDKSKAAALKQAKEIVTTF